MFHLKTVFVYICVARSVNTNGAALDNKHIDYRKQFSSIANNPLLVNFTEAIGDTAAYFVSNIFKKPYTITQVETSTPISNRYNTLAFINEYLPSATQSNNEDANLDIRHIIRKYGFPLEEYEVITEDGYNLTMFRIPGKGQTVFIQHGWLESSDDFFTAGLNNGLGYLLAKDGYDVWLGNTRGNKHSRRHVTLEPHQAEFWDFSGDEIGYYDLPVMIDFVLQKTSSSTLKYLSHSQGMTFFLVMTSLRPEYNGKISIVVALSPVAYTAHTKSPVLIPILSNGYLLHDITKTVGFYEILPDNTFLRSIKSSISNLGAISDVLFPSLLFLVVGMGYSNIDFESVPVIAGHFPSGSSTKQLIQSCQNYLSGEFRQFDYGKEGNRARYGSEFPPSYPLERVTAPVALFTSDNDWLAPPEDVLLLRQRLTNVVYERRYKRLNHQDYIWGKNVKTLVYPYLRRLLVKY